MNYSNNGIIFTIISSFFLLSCGSFKINNGLQESKEKKITFYRPVKIFSKDSAFEKKDTKTVKRKRNKNSKKSILLKDSTIVNLKKKLNSQKLVSNKPSSLKKNKKKVEMSLSYPENIYDHWMIYFKGKNKKRFNRQVRRGAIYFSLIRDIFNRHGLPEDLYYVGLIESGFHLSARSRANAVGPWQFMKGTAKMHGLKVNSYVDERKSIFKSTEAAARYFKDLYNIFGSWELALCAYNAGEYRVINAIRRGNSRNYKVLVKKKLLPKETIYYVPKFAAARNLGRAFLRTRKGRSLVTKGSDKLKKVGQVEFRRSFSIFDLVKRTKLKISALREYNPDLKRNRIRVSSRKPYVLYVDKHSFESSANYFKFFKTPNLRKKSRVDNKRRKRIFVKVVYEKYKVRSGDNLSKIAKKYKIPLASLKVWNHLKRSKIFKGQLLRVKKLKQYTVKEGDNLTSIAKKLKTSVRKIVRFNSLKTKKIFPRQKIHIPI